MVSYENTGYELFRVLGINYFIYTTAS